jgi:hypothetical protein
MIVTNPLPPQVDAGLLELALLDDTVGGSDDRDLVPRHAVLEVGPAKEVGEHL